MNCSNDHLGNCGASVPTHGLYALGIVERLRLVWRLIHEATVTLLSLENARIVDLGGEGGGEGRGERGEEEGGGGGGRRGKEPRKRNSYRKFYLHSPTH